jgi:catechol 2,3-dioxygenase-like lactoylglutathione lyase family enzyme
VGGTVTGLGDQRVEIALMGTRTATAGSSCRAFSRRPWSPIRNTPVNALGYLRVMFAVDDLDGTLALLEKHGVQLVGEVVQYDDAYRLCYIRGPGGLVIGLAQELD